VEDGKLAVKAAAEKLYEYYAALYGLDKGKKIRPLK